MSMRWRHTQKSLRGKRKRKSRLVARGFMDKRDRGWINTHSGTCDRGHLRIAIVFSLHRKLRAGKADVKTAFLQVDTKDPLVLKLPSHLPEKVVSKLGLTPGGFYEQNKAVYGTIDAPRLYTQAFKKRVNDLGWREIAESLLVQRTRPDGPADSVMPMHVDDLLCLTDKPLDELNKIGKAFELDDPELLSANTKHMYCGLELEFSADGSQCLIGQSQYADGIKTGLTDKQRKGVITEKDLRRAVAKDVDPRLQKQQQHWMGKLGWLSLTQLHLLVPFSMQSKNNTKPSEQTVIAAQRLCEFAKATHQPLRYDNSVSDPALVFWVDAAFDLRKCQGRIGWEVQLIDKQVLVAGKLEETIKQVPRGLNVVEAKSRSIERQVASSTAVELLALRDGVKRMPLYSRVVKELWGKEPLQVYATDNQPLVKWLNNKWIDSDPEWQGTLDYVIERVTEKSAHVIWVPTAEQRADRYTKFIRHKAA